MLIILTCMSVSPPVDMLTTMLIKWTCVSKAPTGRDPDTHVGMMDMHVKWYLVTSMLVRLTFMSIMPLVDILTTMIGRLTYMS